jgi:hypothetical protein
MIAAMSCAEIGDEALTGIMPVKPIITRKVWQDFGWFINEKGYRQYGVIPNKSWM